MTRFQRVVLVPGLVLVLLGWLGCASAPEPPEPDWLQSLRAREAEPLPPQKVRSPDRFFRARVPARLARPIQTAEEAYGVSLDIGTTAPVDCWIYRDSVDFGASLSLLSEETFGAISQRLGRVELRKIDRVDAGILGRSPYLAVDWMYRLQTDEGPRVGLVKHLVAAKDGRGLYCQHNEVGYANTFRGIVRALLDTLEYREPLGPKPFFSQISTLSVRGMRVGVEAMTLTRDGDRDVRIDTQTTLLLPVTDDTLQVSDTYAVEFARPDGRLINQVHVESTNGEIVSHLELNPVEDGVWSVEGTFQGKPLSRRLDPPKQPISWLGEALTLRKALANEGTGGAVTTTRWVPGADPTRLLDGTLSIERQVGPERFAARLVAGGLEADLVVDRRGTVTGGSLDMGVASVDFERVYVGGAF